MNNTPRQIHIFRALGRQPPVYAHLPTVLNESGEKMSKRHGAKPVTQYRDEGYLADAIVNYLARLGWSHGDDEIFSKAQLIEWFNLDHLGKSAGQFDEAKLRWVNGQHIKSTDDDVLAPMVAQQLGRMGHTDLGRLPLTRAIALFKDRCATTVEIAEWLAMYCIASVPAPHDLATHLTDAVRPALAVLRDKLASVSWDKVAINAAIKEVLAAHGLKMPQLALPLRLLVCGRAQTPSIDAVLELFNREAVLARLQGV